MGWSSKYKKSIDCKNPKGFSQRAHCQGKKKNMNEEACPICGYFPCQCLEGTITEKRDGKGAKSKGYSLRDWFKGGGWVQAGGKYDGKPCAKQPGQKTKPFCRDADDRAAMSKDERERRAKKKRREDPNPNRKGKAKMVSASYSNWRSEIDYLLEKKKDERIANVMGGPTLPGEKGKPVYPAGKAPKPTGAKLPVLKAGVEPEGDLVDENLVVQGKLSYGSTPGKATKKSVSSAVDKALANKGTAVSTASEKGKTGITGSGSISYSGRVKLGGDSNKPNKPKKKPTRPDKPKPTNNKPKPTNNKPRPTSGGPKPTSSGPRPTSGGPRPVPTRTGNRPSGGGSGSTGGIMMRSSYQPEGDLVDEGKKDACYHKVKSRYSVWPSAYASGALVKCRKVGAKNWGNKTKKEEFELDEKCWAGYEKKGMKTMFGKRYPNCVKKKKTRKEAFEFSNWRDDFKATEYEFIDIIKPAPMKGLAEAKTKDHEHQMARSEISKIVSAAGRLKKKVKGEGNLKAWVQSKITRAADYIDTAADYMDSHEGSDTHESVNEKCWDGYVQKGLKKKGKRMVPNCVKEFSDWRSEIDEGAAWTRKEGKNKSGGLNEKGRKSYERENPGSDLKAPSKKKGNKRRKSFCARMKGMKAKLTSKKTARDPDSRINKSLRAWNC